MTELESRIEARLARGRCTIKVVLQRECSGAAVFVGDELVMMGNFWDFHPGCHGLNAWGDWTSCDALAICLQERSRELRNGKPPCQITRRNGRVF